jgi:dTDP-4-amino-4,6-dideoxygalactose transaminase/CelD/BcsL family acetyltransferase involved in cellulose biosynthesis
VSGRLSVWAPLPPTPYGRRPAAELPYPLGEPGARLFRLGRDGLLHGVRALGLVPGDEVLVPAWHHGSEVEALLGAGLVPRFYDATAALAPDPAELERLRGPATRALHLTHYLGFPQDAPRWRRWCDDRGLLLFEDAAQAWLATVDSRPAGSFGDLSIVCLYKTVGVPDGAALVLRDRPADGRESTAGAALAALARRHAAWVAARSAPVGALAAALARDGDYRSEQDFAVGEPAGPSAASRFLLRRLALDVAPRRRAHYRLLLDELGDLVPSPFGALPEGASPFAFPVAVDDKRGLIERLAQSGVEGVDFWSVAHRALPAAEFPGAAGRRAGTVLLPVHQELRPPDVERIARAARGSRAPARPRVEWHDELGAVREDWERLAERGRNVFSSWDWADVWWRHYGAGRALHVGVVRQAGAPVAVLPLVVARERPVRVLRMVGHGPADELGPVCAPRDSAVAGRALRRALADLDGDLLLAERVRASGGWAALLGGAGAISREAFPLLRWSGGWESYLAGRGHLRRRLRQLERGLARDHSPRYRLTTRADTLTRDFDALLGLHRARWGGASEFTAHEPFHREFGARAAERGWLRLWLLELDGEPAAAWYGFRYAGVESHYQSGRDPRFDRLSTGMALLAHTIQAALDDGLCEYRMLRGAEPIKRRFATEDPRVETLALARGAAARALRAGGRVAGAVPALRSMARRAGATSPGQVPGTPTEAA